MTGENRRDAGAEQVISEVGTQYVTSLVHPRACWPLKSRCSEILVSRTRAVVTYISKKCSPIRGAARDSLVSPIPHSLGGQVH
jgi:hypothetical protein